MPGRLEVVATPDGGAPCTVLVDYAHTPAGLEVALGEARRLAGAGGRVLVVFGCGGDRDRTKRPLMGEAATRLADVAVLTSDNPRHEDPEAIAAEVLAGVGALGGPRRAPPVACSSSPTGGGPSSKRVGLAGAGDVVVVAGKGHETTQEVGGRSPALRRPGRGGRGARGPDDVAGTRPNAGG